MIEPRPFVVGGGATRCNQAPNGHPQAHQDWRAVDLTAVKLAGEPRAIIGSWETSPNSGLRCSQAKPHVNTISGLVIGGRTAATNAAGRIGGIIAVE